MGAIAEFLTEIVGVGSFYLDWTPMPGNILHVEGNFYRVLERKHRYLLRKGRYQLAKMLLVVEKIETSDSHGIIGDPTCRFNARSEFLRCAINPSGPCTGCPHYQSISRGAKPWR
ncbi:MAG: DUF6464 family protein [Pseudanabaenaceae cyanobacterium]